MTERVLCLAEGLCDNDSICQVNGDTLARCVGYPPHRHCLCSVGHSEDYCVFDGNCTTDADCQRFGDEGATCRGTRPTKNCFCIIGLESGTRGCPCPDYMPVRSAADWV